MKVLIGTESYSPTISGVAVFSRYLAWRLAERGLEVHVICPSTTLHTHDEQDHNVTVHRIRSRPNPFRKHHRNSFISGPVVRRLMKQIQPDIIHLQDPLATCRDILKIARVMQIPVVMTNHFAFDYVLSYLPWAKRFHPQIAKMLDLYLTSLYNQCRYITFPSQTIQGTFLSSKLKTPSRTVSNGVDLEQFYPSFNYEEMRLKHHIPKKPIILHVGRLDPDKKSYLILEAFAKVLQHHDVHLIICGEGNLKTDLQRKAVEAGINPHITFIGFVDHRIELPQIYQMATVFATASTIETQGIVALEAMASELPLVVPNAGALPELVKDGVNGYLFSPDDSDEMANKIGRILSDPIKARAMGEKSLEMVEEHEIDRSIDKFIAIYQQLAT